LIALSIKSISVSKRCQVGTGGPAKKHEGCSEGTVAGTGSNTLAFVSGVFAW